MFEYEEAGGLHDVFLNKHAVNNIILVRKTIFPNFERQMFFASILDSVHAHYHTRLDSWTKQKQEKIIAEKVIKSHYLVC